MVSRRKFLKKSSLITGSVVTGGLFLHACKDTSSSPGPDSKIGLQLYTIRDAMDENPEKSLARVAELGYDEVESATYTGTGKFYGMTGQEFDEVLRKNGLSIPSGHYLLGSEEIRGTILSDWEQAVEDAATIGMKYMVCAWLPEEQRETIDHYKQVAEWLNHAGEICKNNGIQLCYHNHEFEFEELSGQIPYELLLQDMEEDLVKMELDIYWTVYAGYDPVDLFQKNKGRYVLWHVKDMADSPDRSFTEVGNGTIDWNRLFQYSEVAGMKHFFVEQDVSESPFDSIEQSITYIKERVNI